MTDTLDRAVIDDRSEPASTHDPTSRELRNCTPDRLLVTNAVKQTLVLAPLETRELTGQQSEWPLAELARRGLVEFQHPGGKRDYGWLPAAAAAMLVLCGYGGTFTESHLPHSGWQIWIGLGVGYAVILVVLIVVAAKMETTITRHTAQFVMMLLVLLISAGVPTAAVWHYDDGTLSSDLAAAIRVIVVSFVALATMLPGLLFFFFDRQRMSTLRDRFERQIFRLDPNVHTLADVYARYGSQINEAFFERRETTTSRVARQRRWPILVATFAIALGWMVALMPIGEIAEPNGPAEAAELIRPLANPVSFGFLGAYFFALQMCLRRYARNDLRPKAFSAITVRIFVTLILTWVLAETVGDLPRNLDLVLAFFVGIVPETFLTYIREKFPIPPVKHATGELEERLPLSRIEGIDIYDRSRLLDEGVANIESLAHEDLVDLLLETRIPVGRLVDWVDQAVLQLHVVHPSSKASENEQANESVLVRLRDLGIRGATDLQRAAALHCHRTPLVAAVRRDGDSDAVAGSRLEILLKAIGDDEWMPHIAHWRKGGHVRDRSILVDNAGHIVADDYAPASQEQDRCCTPTPTAPTTASPPPPTPPAGTDRS